MKNELVNFMKTFVRNLSSGDLALLVQTFPKLV